MSQLNFFLFSGQGGQPGSSGSSDKVGPDGLYFNLNDNAGRGSNGHNGVHAGSNGDNDLFSTSGGLNSPFRYVEKIRENNMSQLFTYSNTRFAICKVQSSHDLVVVIPVLYTVGL